MKFKKNKNKSIWNARSTKYRCNYTIIESDSKFIIKTNARDIGPPRPLPSLQEAKDWIETMEH